MEYFDCHVHYSLPIKREDLYAVLKENGIYACNIVTVPNFKKITSTPDALAYKYLHPDCYVFSSLEIAEYCANPRRAGYNLTRYVERMLKAGCDGVKMIEGKPEFRKMFPIPDFDSNVFDPFWRYINDKQIPVLFHVNDPEELWDIEHAPKDAIENGWVYDDTFVKNEDQYTQVLNVLMRYPNLKIIFPHFFFLSKYLDTLSKILDEFPNICIDIAPGVELFHDLSENNEAARAFFEKHKNRILFGTDIGLRSVVSSDVENLSHRESAVRAELCKKFLSEDGEFELENDKKNIIGAENNKFFGLGLDEETQQLICRDNFLNFVGKKPNEVVPKKVISECNVINTRLSKMKFPNGERGKESTDLNNVVWFFKNMTEKNKKKKK